MGNKKLYTALHLPLSQTLGRRSEAKKTKRCIYNTRDVYRLQSQIYILVAVQQKSQDYAEHLTESDSAAAAVFPYVRRGGEKFSLIYNVINIERAKMLQA